MNSPAAPDWSGARGEKWSAQLAGMESTLVPVDEPLMRALQLDAPLRIADVGCGGGGTTLAILRHAAAGSVVHGFDISPKLVELARQRAPSGDRAVAFDVADMATATPPRAYDRLVSRFGVMFFADPPAAFTNLARWLGPQGRFAFAVWGQPSDNPWLASARDVVARFAEMPHPNLDEPGAFRYADADKLLALLEQAGFVELALHDWRGTLPIGGALAANEAARFALAAFSSFHELLAGAGQQARDEAQRLLSACYAEHERDGAVHMDACVHIVTGRRR